MLRNRFFKKKNGRYSRIWWLIGLVVGIVENAALVAITILLVWALHSRNMPALGIWHTTALTSEFTSRDATPHSTLQDYLEQEDRLFGELKSKIVDHVAPTAELDYSRYRASMSSYPHLRQHCSRY